MLFDLELPSLDTIISISKCSITVHCELWSSGQFISLSF